MPPPPPLLPLPSSLHYDLPFITVRTLHPGLIVAFTIVAFVIAFTLGTSLFLMRRHCFRRRNTFVPDPTRNLNSSLPTSTDPTEELPVSRLALTDFLGIRGSGCSVRDIDLAAPLYRLGQPVPHSPATNATAIQVESSHALQKDPASGTLSMSLTSDDSYVAPITARPAARVTASASKPEEEVCAVCLDALEEGQRVRKLPCDHVYHDPCAVVWLIKADRCPVCARPVCREEEENREEEVVQPRRRWPSFWNAPSR